MATVPEFRPTDASAGNLIRSVALLNTAGDKVLFVGNIPGAGLPMANVLDNIIATLVWQVNGGGTVELIS